jgi:hypothetical protein
MNPLFSKLISLILVVLILFSIFRYIYLDYATYNKNNPYLVEYEKNINELTDISNSKINVSEDQRNGLEFTYAFWLNISSIDTSDNSFLFKKGNNDDESLKLTVHSNNGDDNRNDNRLKIPTNSQKLVNLKLRVPIYEGNNNSKCIYKTNAYDCLPPCNWTPNTPSEEIAGPMSDDQQNEWKRQNGTCKMVTCDNFNANTYYNQQASREDNKVVLGNCESYNFCKYDSTSNPPACKNRKYHDLIIQNVPFKHWFHLSLVFINKYVDIYINGNLYNRFELANIIEQNNSNLNFGPNGSKIMRLQYFNYALPNYKIQNLVSNTDINVDPTVNKYIDNNYFNKKYWVKDNLANI